MSNMESLAKVSKDLMLIEPFYGLFLINLNKSWEKVGTACVANKDLNFYLKIDPDFWATLNYNQRMGLLKHELLHIAFFHLTDFSHLRGKQNEYAELTNIAMDIEINQYIREDWLPPNPLLPESFPELNLEYKKGTFYYYEKLKQEADSQMKQILSAIGQAMANGESQAELPDGSKVDISNHNWEEMDKMDEATERLVKAQVAHILEQTAEQVQKSQGNIPGEIAEILERIRTVEPPKFDWRGYLRRFVGKSVKVYTKKSRRKFNKRLPDFPGLKIKQQKHVLVAIDTSASVSTKELKEFLQEIHHMYKTGSEVTIIQCDTAISFMGPFNPNKDFTVHGRGGTSFQPVVDYYNEHNHKYSCLIYFTDGEAPAPDDCKGNVLWVLSEQSHKTDHLPGQTIQLN
jgi:predicted metal-dependent peptidase